MRQRVNAEAQRDIGALLDWSFDNFGAPARLRYERLIQRGLDMLLEHHDPLGSRLVKTSHSSFRLYHLRNCRGGAADDRVSDPRHVLVYKLVEPDLVVVLRVLHDAMDMPSHFGN